MPQMPSARDTYDGTAFTEVKWAYACWRPIFTTRTKPACPCLSYAKEAVLLIFRKGVDADGNLQTTTPKKRFRARTIFPTAWSARSSTSRPTAATKKRIAERLADWERLRRERSS